MSHCSFGQLVSINLKRKVISNPRMCGCLVCKYTVTVKRGKTGYTRLTWKSMCILLLYGSDWMYHRIGVCIIDHWMNLPHVTDGCESTCVHTWCSDINFLERFWASWGHENNYWKRSLHVECSALCGLLITSCDNQWCAKHRWVLCCCVMNTVSCGWQSSQLYVVVCFFQLTICLHWSLMAKT